MKSRQQSCRNRFCISFHAANLSGKEDIRMPLHLETLFEKRWGIEIRVAVDLPIAEKPRVLKSRNETQHARLLREFQVVLEAHQVIRVSPQVLVTKLHDRIRKCSRSGIAKSHRFHRTKPQGNATA